MNKIGFLVSIFLLTFFAFLCPAKETKEGSVISFNAVSGSIVSEEIKSTCSTAHSKMQKDAQWLRDSFEVTE